MTLREMRDTLTRLGALADELERIAEDIDSVAPRARNILLRATADVERAHSKLYDELGREERALIREEIRVVRALA